MLREGILVTALHGMIDAKMLHNGTTSVDSSQATGVGDNKGASGTISSESKWVPPHKRGISAKTPEFKGTGKEPLEVVESPNPDLGDNMSVVAASDLWTDFTGNRDMLPRYFLLTDEDGEPMLHMRPKGCEIESPQCLEGWCKCDGERYVDLTDMLVVYK